MTCRGYATLRKAQKPWTPAEAQRRPQARDPIYREYTLDEDIKSQLVQSKDPETGKLNPPEALRSLLFNIDREVQVVRQLGTPQGAPPVVEIAEKTALLQYLRDKEEREKQIAKGKRESKPKQIELNWAINSHDLEMKLNQLRSFLDKGKRVEILLAAKKRQRKATEQEAQNLVSEIKKLVADLEGCREVSPMQGRVGGQAIMTLQKLGKSKPQSKEHPMPEAGISTSDITEIEGQVT